MLLLIGMVKSEIREFVGQYIPPEYLTSDNLIGLGFFLFILLFSYLVYKKAKKDSQSESNQRVSSDSDGENNARSHNLKKSADSKSRHEDTKERNKKTSLEEFKSYELDDDLLEEIKQGLKETRKITREMKEKYYPDLLDEKHGKDPRNGSSSDGNGKNEKRETGNKRKRTEGKDTDKEDTENREKESQGESKTSDISDQNKSVKDESKRNNKKKVTRPKSSSSEPVEGSRKQDNTVDKKLYLGYAPTEEFEQQEDWKYPVVKMPEKGSVIRQPTEGKQQLRGYTEQAFQTKLETIFNDDFHISGNSLLAIRGETRPYEPDISISYFGNNRNIFIDVEIDEPYGGISRSATHLKGEDDIRDFYFTDRGWIVIRFAEIQIYNQPERCIGLIAKVLKKIAPELSLSNELIERPLPKDVKQWDLLQAQKLEKKDYREDYLNHKFRKQGKREKGNKGVELSELDKEVEKEVNPTIFTDEEPEKSSSNSTKRAWQIRDQRIKFYPQKHIYLIDGVKAKSVSEVVSRFFPEFDSRVAAEKYADNRGIPHSKIPEIIEEWNEKGNKAKKKGTHLHSQIENYLNGDPYDEPEVFQYFLNFMEDHKGLNTLRTEWRIFDEQKLIAGTIDYVTENNDGTYNIYDWKRSKNVLDDYLLEPKTTDKYQSGIGDLKHIDDTSYNRYCLQQGIYKELLESSYNINISEMNLVVMHPRYEDYHKVAVKDYSEEVAYMMEVV